MKHSIRIKYDETLNMPIGSLIECKKFALDWIRNLKPDDFTITITEEKNEVSNME